MNTWMRATLVFALAAVVLGIVGCGASTVDPAQVEGDWKLEAFGGATELEPADATVATEITLKGGEATGNGGVNSFSATYEAADDAGMRFGPVVSTKMAGPDNAMAQETRFFQALADTRHFEMDGEKLVLSGTGNDTLAVLIPK